MPYDRWHKSRPKDGESTCKEHGKVPTRDHGTGKRWQARWRNREDVQQTELFRTEVEARRHETKMRSGVDDGSYINPRAGEVRSVNSPLRGSRGTNTRIHGLTDATRSGFSCTSFLPQLGRCA